MEDVAFKKKYRPEVCHKQPYGLTRSLIVILHANFIFDLQFDFDFELLGASHWKVYTGTKLFISEAQIAEY